MGQPHPHPSVPLILGTFYRRAHGMKNSKQTSHGDQPRLEEKISEDDQPPPWPETFVTWTAFSDYTGPDLLCSTVFHFYLFIYFFLVLGRAVD